jgi:hypothetical protein
VKILGTMPRVGGMPPRDIRFRKIRDLVLLLFTRAGILLIDLIIVLDIIKTMEKVIVE